MFGSMLATIAKNSIKNLGGITQTPATIGTPAYMPTSKDNPNPGGQPMYQAPSGAPIYSSTPFGPMPTIDPKDWVQTLQQPNSGDFTPGQTNPWQAPIPMPQYPTTIGAPAYMPPSAPGPTNAPTGNPSFDIPTGLYPTSDASNWSNSSNLSNALSGSSNQSNSSGYSGLPQQVIGKILGTLVPQLTSAIPNMYKNVTDVYRSMPDDITKYMARAQRGFKDAATGPIQGVLNNLASRNMLNSKVGADTMSQLGTSLNQQYFGDLANAALQTQLESKKELGKFEQAYPGILAGIAGLGQASQSSGTSSGSSFGSSQSQGTSASGGQSHSQNPLAPYELFLNLIGNL